MKIRERQTSKRLVESRLKERQISWVTPSGVRATMARTAVAVENCRSSRDGCNRSGERDARRGCPAYPCLSVLPPSRMIRDARCSGGGIRSALEARSSRRRTMGYRETTRRKGDTGPGDGAERRRHAQPPRHAWGHLVAQHPPLPPQAPRPSHLPCPRIATPGLSIRQERIWRVTSKGRCFMSCNSAQSAVPHVVC